MHEGKKEVAYTYMLECKDGSFYTGWTNHLEERIQCHNAGKGAKYTKARLPVRLIYYEVWKTKQEAMKREYAIKQLSKKDKCLLVSKKTEEIEKRCRAINQKLLEEFNKKEKI